MIASSALMHIYHKYSAYYGPLDTNTLQDMITKAVSSNEQSCSLFEEHASQSEPSYTADDLEHLFESGLNSQDYPSLKSLIMYHLHSLPFRHILKIRTALTRDCDAPIISVQYILVWKK